MKTKSKSKPKKQVSDVLNEFAIGVLSSRVSSLEGELASMRSQIALLVNSRPQWPYPYCWGGYTTSSGTSTNFGTPVSAAQGF